MPKLTAAQALEDVASPGNIWDVHGDELLEKLRALGFQVIGDLSIEDRAARWVITCDHVLTRETAERIAQYFYSWLNTPGKVLLLERGFELHRVGSAALVLDSKERPDA